MKTGIVIDSVCDLPRAFLDEKGIEVLPVSLHLGERSFEDTRDPEATKAFYRDFVADKNEAYKTRAPDIEGISKLFLDKLVLNYSRVVVVTCAATRSRLFKNATQASYALLKLQRHRRQAAGLPGGFQLRVVDSQSMYAGEAVVAHEAVRLAAEEPEGLETIRQALETLGGRVETFLVPEDAYFLRFRAREKGEKTIGPVGYQLARIFDLKPVIRMRGGQSRVIGRPQSFERALDLVFDEAREAIAAGLSKPLVAMSYAGEPADIRQLRGYQSFAAYADSFGIELTLAVMSATSGVNVGPGAFSLAYAV